MQILSITKKIAVVASLVALYSGQVTASGYDRYEEGGYETGRQCAVVCAEVKDSRFQDPLPVVILRKIMEEAASAGANPVHVADVCRFWHDVMCENNAPNPHIRYSNMNSFMQRCVRKFWAHEDRNRFNNGFVRYKPPRTSQVVALGFADLDQTNGIFALPGHLGSIFRIMTNVREFFTNGGENVDRILVLAVLHNEAVEAAREMNENHPFVRVVKKWDISKTGIGLFYRNEGDKPEKWGLSHLTSASFDEITRLKSLWEILKKFSKWRGSSGWRFYSDWGYDEQDCCARVSFVFEPKKDYRQESEVKEAGH